MEKKHVFGDETQVVTHRAIEGRPAGEPKSVALLPVHCRYCHQGYGLLEVQPCSSCGAYVCEMCGGTLPNPNGDGNVCMQCLRATVAFRERWHRHTLANNSTDF